MAFFDLQDLIYTHIIFRDTSINTTYITKALGKFMDNFKKKSSGGSTGTTRQFTLALVDFFLFRRGKEALAGIAWYQDSLKNSWERVTRSITADDYATAFRRWFEQKVMCE
jgi:hypothetical protein